MAQTLSNSSSPLVTVGLPSYNRPSGLHQTLTDITNQTYGNLEIIVSDNGSSNTECVRVAQEYASRDARITMYRHPTNIGPFENFESILSKARGKYFALAADDDRREPWFIERCVAALESRGSSATAAITEAQYFSGETVFPFFAEGSAFRAHGHVERRERLRLMLEENYGNLFYSVYRRDALFIDSTPLFSALKIRSLNETPLLLHVVARGDWIVLPEIGMRKEAPLSAYLQARWEKQGGRLPKVCGARTISAIRSLYSYHAAALAEIRRALALLSLPPDDAKELDSAARRKVWMHFLSLLHGYRRRQ